MIIHNVPSIVKRVRCLVFGLNSLFLIILKQPRHLSLEESKKNKQYWKKKDFIV